MDCHTKDPHGGQFVTRADGGDCAACHTAAGWKPSTFVEARHGETRYPLQGRHSGVACAECHLPVGAATRYRIEFDRCAGCHRDPHQGQFAAAHGDRCEDCHAVKGFRPSSFTLARHGEARFGLEGAHRAIACADCHTGSPARFRFEDHSCQACHRDPHRGQFGERMVAARARGGAVGCSVCHTFRAWRDLARFDHATTEFPLVGAHRQVACAQCHRPSAAGVGIATVDFRAAPLGCAGCHEDVHAGQFATGAETNCARCHDPLRWKPARFDHDKDAKFSLVGAHRRVACAQCHTTSRDVNGKAVRTYKTTPRECSSCHGPEITN